MTTPTFGNIMTDNNMANAKASATGNGVGIGSSVFQIVSSVLVDRWAMTCMLLGVYIVAMTWLAGHHLLDSSLIHGFDQKILVGTTIILAYYVCTSAINHK